MTSRIQLLRNGYSGNQTLLHANSQVCTVACQKFQIESVQITSGWRIRRVQHCTHLSGKHELRRSSSWWLQLVSWDQSQSKAGLWKWACTPPLLHFERYSWWSQSFAAPLYLCFIAGFYSGCSLVHLWGSHFHLQRATDCKESKVAHLLHCLLQTGILARPYITWAPWYLVHTGQSPTIRRKTTRNSSRLGRMLSLQPWPMGTLSH